MQYYRENTQPYIGAEDSHRHYAQYAEVEPRLVGLYERVLALKAGRIAEMLDEFEQNQQAIMGETGMSAPQFWPYHLNQLVMTLYKDMIKPEITTLLDAHPDNPLLKSNEATEHACGYLLDLVYQDVQALALERGYLSAKIF